MSALQQLIKNTHTTVGENIEPKTLVDIMTGKVEVPTKPDKAKIKEAAAEATLDKTWLNLGQAFGLNINQLRRVQAGEDIDTIMKEGPVTDPKVVKAMEDELREATLNAEAAVQGEEISKAYIDNSKLQSKLRHERAVREREAKKSEPESPGELPEAKGLGL